MSHPSVPPPDFAEPRSPWTRPGFILSAGLLALVVCAGAGVAVVSMFEGDPDPGQGQVAPPPGGGTDASAGPEHPDTLPTAIPTVVPRDVTWNLLGQRALPVSASAGPRNITDTTASGYAHSPEGALIAAVQLGARGSFSSGREVWEPTITRQWQPSPDRDKYLAGLRQVPESEKAKPGELSALVGYRYLSYTPDTAVVSLIRKAPGRETYHATVATLVWADGDWRYVAPAGGNWMSVRSEIQDLTGVVEWGPR